MLTHLLAQAVSVWGGCFLESKVGMCVAARGGVTSPFRLLGGGERLAMLSCVHATRTHPPLPIVPLYFCAHAFLVPRAPVPQIPSPLPHSP